MMNKTNKTQFMIADTPWRNSYWFARMLLNGDKYGSVGRKKERQLLELVVRLEAILAQKALVKQEKLSICKNALLKAFAELFIPSASDYLPALLLAEDIASEFNSVEDIVVFIVSVKYIVAPMNAAIAAVPSNDTEFCHETATSILDTLGEAGVGKVISTWDNLGEKGCLDVERSLVVSEFTKLRNILKSTSATHNDNEENIVLTAFVQEFERRLGQKRKGRAGKSLEDVSTFIFNYYNFTSHPKPDHFQTDIEVDKWFKCKDGWLIGISCKRTLRERWKQVSSADNHALSRYKIKEIWHLTTFDKDLSDEKITMLGQQRQIFYLDDETEKFKSASSHIGMKDYVRPLTHLISDIRREQRG